MGYEYLTQPQIFLAPITATNGIYGINEAWPLLTTYQSWTSTAAVNASAFSIPGTWTMLNESGSFLITVGGVLQQPSEYTVNRDLRTLTFNSLVSAGVEIGVQQLATAAPSSQNFNNLTSVSATFQTLSSRTGIFDTLLVTNLTGLSTVVNIIDVRISEVSGFRSTGDVQIDGDVAISRNLFVSGNIFLDPNDTISQVTTPTITLLDTGSFIGATSGTSINIGALSARTLDLIHSPANDGVDPIFNIGETGTAGFSGFRIRYEEPTNRLIGLSRTGTTTLTSFIIDVATGQVGISGLPAPGQALTVNGNISAAGSLFAGPGTTALAPITLLSGGPLTIAQPGSIERGQYGFFATPAGSQRGIITAPQTFLLNADRTGPTGITTFSIFGVGCNLAVGKYGYRIVFTATKSSTNASQIQYALTTTSGTIASHYYQVLGNTAAAVTTLAAPQQMSNYITTNFSTLVTVTVAGAVAASIHNTIIDGILDISADVVGLNPQFAFTGTPTTSFIKAGSYIQIWPLGSATNANVSVGSWA
jgi:hypothetical protein